MMACVLKDKEQLFPFQATELEKGVMRSRKSPRGNEAEAGEKTGKMFCPCKDSSIFPKVLGDWTCYSYRICPVV